MLRSLSWSYESSPLPVRPELKSVLRGPWLSRLLSLSLSPYAGLSRPSCLSELCRNRRRLSQQYSWLCRSQT